MRTSGLSMPIPERNGGHHHIHAPLQEVALGAVPLLSAHPRVIGACRQAAAEHLSLLLGGLAGRRVDDSRPALGGAEQPQQGGAVAGRGSARPIPGRGSPAGTRGSTGRSRPRASCSMMSCCTCGVAVGGESDDRGRAQARQALLQPPVLRPKVVAPHRNAMRLVNGHQPEGPAREQLGEARHSQPLGSDVEEVEVSGEVVAADLPRSEPVPARNGSARPESPARAASPSGPP